MKPIFLSILFFAAASAAAKSPTACELLSRGDVKAVQGQAFAEAKHTQSQFDGMISSRCFYRLPSFADSISIDVIRPESPGMNADDLWQKITGKRVEKMTAKGRDHGQTIENLGDTAIWAGNKTAGALYVLENDTILRISIGGAGTEEEKIEKCRKLAARALKKM